MYCSIQEAWPEQQFQNSRSNTLEYFKENMQPLPSLHNPNLNPNLNQNPNPNQTNRLDPINKCYSIIEHIESCPNCKHYIQQRYGRGQNQILELFNTNPQLKETILVFLIGIVILLVLNLFYK